MANQDIYDGEWLCDKAHGYGVKRFASGDEYRGEYQNDHRHGYGVYTWANQDKYEGFWNESRQAGLGTYYYVNKGIFKGTWVVGMKHGRGIYTNNNISVEEVWEQGIRQERVPLSKYFPPRVLKTNQSESGFVGRYSSGIASAQQPREAERIKQLIDQLHNRLQTIESNGSSGNQAAGGSELNPNSLNDSPSPDTSNTVSSMSSPLSSSSSSTTTSTENNHNTTENNNNNTDQFTMEVESGDMDVVMGDTADIEMTCVDSSTTPSSSPSDHNNNHVHNHSHSPTVCVPTRPVSRDAVKPSEELCKICFEGTVNTILIKCGHIAFCLDCANQLERCPVCRSEIDEVIQTFRA